MFPYPLPHVVDVHVGGANSELADVLIKRVSLKPHWTQEGDLGKLVVEHILPIYDPHSCNTFHFSFLFNHDTYSFLWSSLVCRKRWTLKRKCSHVHHVIKNMEVQKSRRNTWWKFMICLLLYVTSVISVKERWNSKITHKRKPYPTQMFFLW